MRALEKYFPVLFVLPFFFATTQFEVLKAPSEIARWVVLFLASGLAFYHGLGRGRQKTSELHLTDYVSLVFLALFAVSSFWSIDNTYSFLRTVSMALLYVAVFWYFWGYADRFGEAQLLRLLLRTSAVLLALNLMIFGVMAPSAILEFRFHGFFVNANNIGLICVLSLPLSFAGLFRTRSHYNKAEFGIFLLSAAACGSRTALVAGFTGMALIAAAQGLRGNRKALWLGGAFAGLIFFAFTSQFTSQTIARTDTLETLSNRTYFWEMAKLDYIPQRPWLGHGFGTDGMIHDHYGIVLKDLQLRGYGVMSSYYGLAVAVGIPLTVLFFGALALSTLWGIFRYWRDHPMMTYSASVVAGMLAGITESAIYSVGNCFAYLFWMAFMLAIRRGINLPLIARQRARQSVNLRKRRVSVRPALSSSMSSTP